MGDLELLPHMYAPLQLMFAEHCVELELKAAHRRQQKQRQASESKIPSAGTVRNFTTLATDHKQDLTDHKQNSDVTTDNRQVETIDSENRQVFDEEMTVDCKDSGS